MSTLRIATVFLLTILTVTYVASCIQLDPSARSARKYVSEALEQWIRDDEFPIEKLAPIRHAAELYKSDADLLMLVTFDPSEYTILETKRVAKGRYRFEVELVGYKRLAGGKVKLAMIELRRIERFMASALGEWEVLEFEWLKY